MLRVFIRHVDYDSLHLANGVRLFVAESTAPAEAAAEEEDDAASSSSGSSSPGGARAAAPVRRCVEGFVLLDPLWREGRVTGYVTSLNRMRQGAHHGEGCGARIIIRAGVRRARGRRRRGRGKAPYVYMFTARPGR